MTLSDEHRQYLSNSAIAPKFLEGLRSSDEGIVFPLTAIDGRVIEQVRPDKPTGDAKYLTSAGETLVLPVPQSPENIADLANSDRPILIVEGTKQHLAAASALNGEPLAVVGMLGCWGWLSDGQPLSDLYKIDFAGRTVTLCLDADLRSNPDVWEAAESLADVLVKELLAKEVRHVRLPGRDREGFDDIMARQPVERRQAVARQLVESASPRLPKKPARRRNEFMGPSGLLVADLYNGLEDRHPMAVTADQTIAVYRNGRYYNGESRAFNQSVQELLGNDFRNSHQDNALEYAITRLVSLGRRLPDRPGVPLVNVNNGLLDLETLELRPHDPNYLSVVQFPVDWDEAATAPTYEGWLTESLEGDQIDAIEQTVAQMLNPLRAPSKVGFLFGPPRSGKSTFLNLAQSIAGQDHSSAVSLHDLATNMFSSAQVYGKILNVCADLSSAHVKDLSVFKQLSGEDLIQGNRKYGKMFTFENNALFLFSANEIPTVGEGSAAYVARIRPFRFPHSNTGKEDLSLRGRLRDELPGIFRRWVMALRELIANEYQFAPVLTGVAEDFQAASDPVVAFLKERTERTGKPHSSSSSLYKAYEDWCEESKHYPLSNRRFGSRLREYVGPDGPVKRDGIITYPLRVREEREEVFKTKQLSKSLSSNKDDSTNPLARHYENNPPFPPLEFISFDLETGSADRRWTTNPDPSYLRLLGWRSTDGNGGVTSDPDEMRELVAQAPALLGHNIHGFDVPVLAWHLGLDFYDLIDKSTDTLVMSRLVWPACKTKVGPGRYKSLVSHSLDELCAKHLGAGKQDFPGGLSLIQYATKLNRKAKLDDKYLAIPADDTDYRKYCQRDADLCLDLLAAIQSHELFDAKYQDREQRLSRIAQGIAWRGMQVNLPILRKQTEEAQRVAEQARATLAEAGVAVNRKVLKEGLHRLDEIIESDTGAPLPRTDKGNISTSKESIATIDHPLIDSVLSLNADRGLAPSTKDWLASDGRVHPGSIQFAQVSGRWSIKEPGMTTYGKRGANIQDRDLFCAKPDHVLFACDLSQIDVRGMAALSGDQEMIARLQPGMDWHEEMAVMAYGEQARGDKALRDKAKALAHSINYNASAQTIADAANITYQEAEDLLSTMKARFVALERFKNSAIRYAKRHGVVRNKWGRTMAPDPKRLSTAAPGLCGQGWARDAMAEGAIRMAAQGLDRFIVCHVHDEWVFEVPKHRYEEIKNSVIDCMSFEHDGVPVLCDVDGPAIWWGDVYRNAEDRKGPR